MGTGPKLGDPHFEAWDEEDSMIMAWLWNSMIPEISDTCMFLATARDAAQVYEVKILGKQEVPCFNEVVALIRGEESRRCLMLNPQNTDSSAMVVTMVTIQPQIWKDQPKTQNRDYKDNLWCTYCKKARHTRERCWKLHRKPPSREWGQKGEQPSNNGQAHVTTVQQNGATPQETGSLNQEEVERVRSLICNLDKPTGTGSLAYSGRGFGEDDWTC
ncbi:hypothetical protein AAG906_011208 [Vitis piasezkii]